MRNVFLASIHILIIFLSINALVEGFCLINNNKQRVVPVRNYRCDDDGSGGLPEQQPCCESKSEKTPSRRTVLKKIISVPAFTTTAVVVTAASRSFSSAAAYAIVPTADEGPAAPADSSSSSSTIEVPLEFISALNAYVVQYYVFGERFGAIVDTGSPFLTVPATCSKWSYKYLWGCYKPELTSDSGYANTVEGFDNNQGTVVWRKAGFTFDEERQPPQDLVFGVFGPDLLDGPGGVFLGLIKETDNWIRPSFLGQTGYESFCVDLRKQQPTTSSKTTTKTTNGGSSSSLPPQQQKLVLSKTPLISRDDDDYIPLVRDLNRRYKAPVVHYTARAAGFVVNGLPLYLSEKKPTYVIFDTGVSGMSVSDELFDGRYLQARKNREKSLWGNVTVAFATRAGNEVRLTATKPLTTPLGKATPWRRFRGNLIVLGLAFLDGLAMTIDTTEGKLQFSK